MNTLIYEGIDLDFINIRTDLKLPEINNKKCKKIKYTLEGDYPRELTIDSDSGEIKGIIKSFFEQQYNNDDSNIHIDLNGKNSLALLYFKEKIWNFKARLYYEIITNNKKEQDYVEQDILIKIKPSSDVLTILFFKYWLKEKEDKITENFTYKREFKIKNKIYSYSNWWEIIYDEYPHIDKKIVEKFLSVDQKL